LEPWLPEDSLDGLAHSRWGAYASAVLRPYLSLDLMAWQTRTWGADRQFRRQQDKLDLHAASLNFQLWDEGLPLDGSVGRFALNLGEGRMVGEDWWNNFSRSFDGGVVHNRTWLGTPLKSAYLDGRAFWTRPVTVEAGDTDDSNANHSDPDVNLSGLFTEIHSPSGWMVGPYAIYDSDRDVVLAGEEGSGSRAIASLGLRWKADPTSFLEFDGETAYQSGRFGGDDHRAWAVHLSLRLHPQFTEPSWLAEALTYHGPVLEYDHASGDRDPADGEHGTFHSPYPSPHNQFGIGDVVGWRNLDHHGVRWDIPLFFVRGEAEDIPQIHPASRFFGRGADRIPVLSLELGYHRYFFAEERDAYYDPRGEFVARDLSGNVDREIASEWDARLLLAAGLVSLGYARFQAGDFLDETGAGEDGSLVYFSIASDW